MKTRKKKTSSKKKKKSTKRSRAAKKPVRSGKTTARRYSRKAQKKVHRVMRELKRGELKMGKSGEKVASPKQAIAIGLSEARRTGAKVPPNPNR
jgi:hypothetical protein